MVLIGTAMLGATASKIYKNLQIAMERMGSNGLLIQPNTTSKNNQIKTYHDCKYKVFIKMLSDQREYKQFMNKCNIVETIEEQKHT